MGYLNLYYQHPFWILYGRIFLSEKPAEKITDNNIFVVGCRISVLLCIHMLPARHPALLLDALTGDLTSPIFFAQTRAEEICR